jgi:GNAT superfamily N-acetyltransferase
MIIKTLDKYNKETAERIRALLIQLSRSGKDRGEIPEEWFNNLINSDYHDMLLAIDDTKIETNTETNDNQASSIIDIDICKGLTPSEDNQVGPIVGIATLSIIMGPIVRKVAYLEDFVTDESYRGKGVGSALWNAILEWSKQKGCTELTFTSGQGREAAQKFYQNRGATIYDTNFFRLPL